MNSQSDPDDSISGSLTPETLDEVRRAAGICGLSSSDFVADAARNAAGKALERAGIIPPPSEDPGVDAQDGLAKRSD